MKKLPVGSLVRNTKRGTKRVKGLVLEDNSKTGTVLVHWFEWEIQAYWSTRACERITDESR
jgi:hypothetical protein